MPGKYKYSMGLVLLIICLLCSCGKNTEEFDESVFNDEPAITATDKTLGELEDLTIKTDESKEDEPNAEMNLELRKTNTPRDVINGIPLYIEFASDYIDSSAQISRREYCHKLEGEYDITISYDGELRFIETYTLDQDEHSVYWLGNRIFCIDYPFWEATGFILHYRTYLWKDYLRKAVALTDMDGIPYTYLLSLDELTNSLVVERVNITKPRHSNENFKSVFGGLDKVTVRFYSYNDWPADENDTEYYEYETEDVSVADFVNEMIDFMLLHIRTRVDDIWCEENTLFVDLNKYEGYMFDVGSLGGVMKTQSLISTLSSLPNIEKIIVLLDGKKGVSGNHFRFDRVFDAGYSIFEESIY